MHSSLSVTVARFLFPFSVHPTRTQWRFQIWHFLPVSVQDTSLLCLFLRKMHVLVSTTGTHAGNTNGCEILLHPAWRQVLSPCSCKQTHAETQKKLCPLLSLIHCLEEAPLLPCALSAWAYWLKLQFQIPTPNLSNFWTVDTNPCILKVKWYFVTSVLEVMGLTP